jgi:hypothetical protein
MAAAPTCRGCSIVDHAIGTRPLLQYAASATTIDQDDVDVQLCGSDHLNHTAPAAQHTNAQVSPCAILMASRPPDQRRLPDCILNALGSLTRL